jgi:hemerythrin-like metal-binding protein
MFGFSFKGPEKKGASHCLVKEVGIAQFNKQHLRLASYAVEFHQIVEELSTREPTAEDWKQIDGVFSRIMRFVHQHFEEEEAVMQEHGYPGFEAHKKLHDDFVAELLKIKRQIAGRNIKFKKKLSLMLWDWLYTHINEVDYGYRDFFIEKGVS